MMSPKEASYWLEKFSEEGKRHVEMISSFNMISAIKKYVLSYCEENKITIDLKEGYYRRATSSGDEEDDEGDNHPVANQLKVEEYYLDLFHGTAKLDNGIYIHSLTYSSSEGPAKIVFASCENTEAAIEKYNTFLKAITSYQIDSIKKSKGKIVEINSDYNYNLITFPKTSWDDVILPDTQKTSIRSSIEGFFKSEKLYKDLGIAWQRGLLMIGPPGNGKTLACRAIASESGVPFVMARLDARSGDYMLGLAWKMARTLSPAVICLEDVDRLFAHGGNGRTSLTYFLNLLDGIQKNNHGILFIGTANHPEHIDKALVNRPSRFDRVFKIEVPNQDSRRKYLASLVKQFKISEEAIIRTIEATDKMSMAFLKEIVTQACLTAVFDGKLAPDDNYLIEAALALKKQYKEAEKDFQKDTSIKPFGSNEDDY